MIIVCFKALRSYLQMFEHVCILLFYSHYKTRNYVKPPVLRIIVFIQDIMFISLKVLTGVHITLFTDTMKQGSV